MGEQLASAGLVLLKWRPCQRSCFYPNRAFDQVALSVWFEFARLTLILGGLIRSVMEGQDRIRVMLVDDLAVVRRGLSASLSAFPDLELVGQARNGAEALSVCGEARPDVILMDLVMPEMDGVTATRLIRERYPGVRVIALTSYKEDELVQGVLNAGAIGYLLKNIRADDLAKAIREAFSDRPTLGPEAARVLIRQSLEHQRVTQELSLAGRVQAGFLPEDPPVISGWEFAAGLVPAGQTSGDFYDFISLPDGRLGILVADVSGKGLGPALYMTLCRTLVRVFASDQRDCPDVVLRAVNERVLTDVKSDFFATTFYAILDPASGLLTYCNAGHLPPYLFRAPLGTDRDDLPTTGIPIGVMAGDHWERRTIRMNPGDLLVLYSDGVTEAENPAGDWFGKERLIATVDANADQAAVKIHEAILDAVTSFVAGGRRTDDLTLVVMARRS
jgi:sigma-B regulation protein RsbU (phosphoserine phosphatase)